MRMRIPTRQEIIIVMSWGGVYTLVHIPYAGIYITKQLARLTAHVANELERLYLDAFIRPLKGLIVADYNVNVIETEAVELLPSKPELFDWNRFRTEPDTFPHIRIIAKSGMGKTTLARYLMHLLGGKQAVVTPKSKPNDWKGLEVYGKRFNYQECEWALEQTLALMSANYVLIDQSLTPEMVNIALDEWRLIKENVQSASDMVKELITVARDAKIRLLALAQGEQVATWGLEGESDLAECFTDIRLGEFAIDYARKIKLHQSVQSWLQQQKRPCMVGRLPAEVPDLSSFTPVAAESPFQRRLESAETAKTVVGQGLQPTILQAERSSEGAENLVWKAFQLSKLSESEFIKQWYGTHRYQEGKAELAGLKAKFQAS
jgi:hypothetical protein